MLGKARHQLPPLSPNSLRNARTYKATWKDQLWNDLWHEAGSVCSPPAAADRWGGSSPMPSPGSQLSLHFSSGDHKISPVASASFCPLAWRREGGKERRPIPAGVEEFPEWSCVYSQPSYLIGYIFAIFSEWDSVMGNEMDKTLEIREKETWKKLLKKLIENVSRCFVLF